MAHMYSGARASAHFLTSFRQFVNLRCPAQAYPSRLRNFTASRRPVSSLSAYVPNRRREHTFTRSTSTLVESCRAHRDDSSATLATGTSNCMSDDTLGATTTSETSKPKERVLLLMSGGVDSSMCAHILHNQGYDVTGLYMHNWNHQEETQDELVSRPTHQQPHPTNKTPYDTLYLTESIRPSSLASETSSNPSLPSLITITTSIAAVSGDPSSSRTPRTAQIRPKICTSDRDWADVQAVCAQIGIPARRLDFSRQYWNQVFEVMLQEYERGRTPNPDVACNREIKFGELIEWCHRNGGLGKDRHPKAISDGNPTKTFNSVASDMLGWDYLATGHYARVSHDPLTGVTRLLRAADSNKDQTYYLSTLSSSVLQHTLFPLAQYDKPTVKKMALTTTTSQLHNAAVKKESMGICFVGQRRRFGEFLEEYLDTTPGPVRVNDLDGPIIGKHKGLVRYTVGQASGVTHGHQKWVVLKTDLERNTLVVVEGTQNQKLFAQGLIAEAWHWISGEPPKKLVEWVKKQQQEEEEDSKMVGKDEVEFPFTAQIRHRQVPQSCTIEPVVDETSGASDLASAQLFRVRFKDPQRAIAPGQQLVLYDQDECLGGAVIQSSILPVSISEP